MTTAKLEIGIAKMIESKDTIMYVVSVVKTNMDPAEGGVSLIEA